MRQLKTYTSSITLRDEECVNAYLKNISKTNPLSIEEETELIKRWRNGDQRAYNKLISANLRFVVSVAKMFMNRGMPLADLIEEGNIGLIKAAEKFDENQGIRFVSYAVWWIRQNITMALNESSNSLRLPANVAALYQSIKKVQGEYEQREFREPSIAEIAEKLNVAKKKIEEAIEATQRLGSLDEPIAHSDEDACYMIDVYNDATQRSTDACLHEEDLHNGVVAMLTKMLPERDADIVMKLFGIGCRRQSATELSMKLGLTVTRINQIKNGAIATLKNSKDFKTLLAYL